MGLSAASVLSFHSPRSPGLIRPTGSTAVPSMQSIPAPEEARLPRCIKCHAFASPFSAEYWHIGETSTRLGRTTPRSVIGENSALMGTSGDGCQNCGRVLGDPGEGEAG